MIEQHIGEVPSLPTPPSFERINDFDNDGIAYAEAQKEFGEALNERATELNTAFEQVNNMLEIFSDIEGRVTEKEALVNPHYAAIDTVSDNIPKINEVVDNISVIQSAEENANLAQQYAQSAQLSAQNAEQTANVVKWVSGSSYLEGECVWSPIDYQTYRAKTNTSGAIDPSIDAANWRDFRSIVGVESENITISGTYQITATNKNALNIALTANGTLVLPDATLISSRVVWYIYNSSDYYVQINDFNGVYKYTLSPKKQAILTCVDTTASAGVWVEQNVVQFNPTFALPMSDVASSADDSTYCGIAKTSPDGSNYHTLFYRNTSNNLVIQSVQITGDTVVSYGNSATIASGVANRPSNIVALNTDTNTGIVVYQNSTTLYVRTFTNINGTLTLGTVYFLDSYYAPIDNGYKMAYDTTAFAISTTELVINAQLSSDTYPRIVVFTTTNNTFFNSLGASSSNYVNTLIKSNIVPGKVYTASYSNSAYLMTNKKAFSVSSAAITPLYSNATYTDYGFAYNGATITGIELAEDIILVAYRTSFSANTTTVKVTKWNQDTNHIDGSLFTVDGVYTNLALRKIGIDTYLLIGTGTANFIKTCLFKLDANYKATVIGSTVSTLNANGAVSLNVSNTVLANWSIPLSFIDLNRTQHALINIKTR